ncbi:MAG: hypothetical protein RL318_1257 [Fibrobacterota bacterium]|jgi:hypothetical protein
MHLFSLALLLLGTSTFAADKYTSTYTDMEKDCENAFPEEEAAPGSDIPARCKGPAGNSIYEYYSGMDSYRSIELAGGGDPVSLHPGFSCDRVVYGKMMEWRLRNGKPFALIYRATCYAGAVNSNPHEAKDRIGEYLVVQPLSKTAPVAVLDVRTTPKANDAARKRAEEIR